ncbi:MAG: hypothetical protein NTV51_21065, partial [Verrucomicrobia bacterium]|nr:hypothetical protein [Verrucomicrobiota bacterium]
MKSRIERRQFPPGGPHLSLPEAGRRARTRPNLFRRRPPVFRPTPTPVSPPLNMNTHVSRLVPPAPRKTALPARPAGSRLRRILLGSAGLLLASVSAFAQYPPTA